MEVVNKGNKQNKLTVNPNDGRVTLKLTDAVNSSHLFKDGFITAAGFIAEEVKAECDVTVRGELKYFNGTFTIKMANNSKSFYKTYKHQLSILG